MNTVKRANNTNYLTNITPLYSLFVDSIHTSFGSLLGRENLRQAGHITSADATMLPLPLPLLHPYLQISKSEHPEGVHSEGVTESVSVSVSSDKDLSVNTPLTNIQPDVKNTPKGTINSSLSTVYCAAFSKDLRRCTCNVRRRDIEVRTYSTSCSQSDTTDRLGRNRPETFNNPSSVHGMHGQSGGVTSRGHKEESSSTSDTPCTSHSPVTFITATTLESFRRGALDVMLESWCGPKVRLRFNVCAMIYDVCAYPSCMHLSSV